ncbi:hypothetical protein OKW20_002428 [Ensifer sp. LBL]
MLDRTGNDRPRRFRLTLGAMQAWPSHVRIVDMKHAFAALSVVLLLSGCTASTGPSNLTYGYSPNLQPIPGSITYGGQPRTKLKKAPVGSIVPHQFIDSYGRKVYETYIIEPDRSLRLTSRRWAPDFLGFDD